MTITVSGTPQATANNTSITLPTHAVGNIIILWVYSISTTQATKPTASGTVPAWVDIDNPTGANSNAGRTAYFVATATNHTSGTWTGANDMCAIVLAGQASSPIGGHGTSSAASGTPTAPAVTMTATDGSSFLLHFFGANSSFAMSWSAAPSGYTQRASAVGSFAAGACMDSKTTTTADGTCAQTASGQSTSFTATLEIVAPTLITPSNHIITRQPVVRASLY
jgi:hypothetical protein